MKTIAVCLIATITFCSSAFALPNSVGGFINPAGMRFEEFATKKTSWEQDAKLLGEWTMWTDESAAENAEVLKLTLTAVVFGLDAKLVTVHRKNETVQKFQVDFADDEKTTRRLRSNLELWADGKWDAAGKTIKHNGTVITLKEGNVVEFSAAA